MGFIIPFLKPECPSYYAKEVMVIMIRTTPMLKAGGAVRRPYSIYHDRRRISRLLEEPHNAPLTKEMGVSYVPAFHLCCSYITEANFTPYLNL
jgi:hypothetical protein